MKKINLKPSEFAAVLARIQEKCGYTFKNQDTLIEALTHPSYAGEHPELPHNQRLEFLGDAVLQIVVSAEIYHRMPTADEGILTRVRSLLAKEHATAEYARELGLAEALLLSHGENQAGGRERESILGDAFEAFLGAVFVDSGIQAARKIFKMVMPDVDDMMQKLAFEENPKGALQEFCQVNYHVKPDYADTKVSGSCHEPVFEVKVSLMGEELAVCQGHSKKIAEKAAAIQALKTLLDRKKNENPTDNMDS